uniref:putative nuclease HARBI1 n=1 Tax=Pristiophorus japonicus TaxID=55135 RepID=UPI00398EEF05
MSEEQCIRRLRFCNRVVTEPCHLLQPDLEADIRTRTSLSVAVKVTVAFSFYASGSFQATAGDICSVSQFAAHCCICKVSDAIYDRRMDYIKSPMTREKQEEWSCGFTRIAGFLMVQGAINFTHVALHASHENAEVFHNHKGYRSLNVQLVCDPTQRMLTVNACHLGSTRDAFILWESTVPQLFRPPHEGHGWPLSDKGYDLTTWLMTPFRNPKSRAEHRYSESHVATRNVIELTIGVLK